MLNTLRDIIVRLRIRYDRAAGSAAEGEAAETLDNVGRHGSIAGRLIATTFTAAITVIGALAKVSMAAARESEAHWNRVSGAVERMGIKWSTVELRVKAAAKALSDATGIGDDQFAVAFDTMLGLTNDFTKSLQNVAFVADIAARFYGGDMVKAATLWGQTVAGNTRGLRALAIETDDVNEGLRILKERAGGAAASELNVLDGKLKDLTDSAGDARKEFGFFIFRTLGSDETQVAINRFKLGLDGIAEWFQRKKLTFDWKKIIFPDWDSFFGFKIEGVLPTEAEVRQAMQAAGLFGPDPKIPSPKPPPKDLDPAKEPKHFDMRAKETARDIIERERAKRREELEAARKQRENAFGAADAAEDAAREFEEAMDDSLDRTTQSIQEKFSEEIGPVAQNAAYGVANAWQDTFELLLTGAANTGEVFETLGRGIGASMLGGLAQYASGKVAENVALSVEEFAKGLAASANPFLAWTAPVHFAASAEHAGTATLWSVLAGGAGAAQNSVAGGGRGGISGGIPSGAADIGGRLAQNAEPRNEIHFYFDQFNKDNPVAVRYAGAVIKAAAAEDSEINIHPYQRG